MNICIILYNTKKIFDIPEPVTSVLKLVTLNYVEISLKALDKPNINYKIVDTEDLNDIFSLDIEYDKYVIIAYGCIIVNPFSFWEYILNDKTDISGQILNLAPNLYSIHEQLLLFNRKVYLDLKNNFKFTNEISYKNKNFVDVIRSKENIHDEYTPLWIEKNSDNTQPIEKKRYKQIQGTYESFIDFVLKNNYRICNFTEEFRHYKIYTYHTFEPITWYNKFTNLDTNIEVPISQQGFFSIFEKTDLCYAYNADSIVPFVETILHDCIVTVASGPLPLYYMSNITENGTIIICDINHNNIIFYKYILSLSIENLNKTWKEIVADSPCAGMFLAGNLGQTETIWRNIKEKVIKNFSKIKTSKHVYICDDIINNKIIFSYIKNANKPFIWFTNVFYYVQTLNKMYNKKSFVEYLENLYYNNLELEWLGKYPSIKGLAYSKNFGKVNETFYEHINIPPINVDNFLKEIEEIENQRLFVRHRSTQLHIGWETFTLHGIAYNDAVRSNGKNDKWTAEALEFCPNIVKYFTENNIRNQYNRVRIMKLKPKGLINIHNDDIRNEPPYKKEMWGMNICINNPIDCKMNFWDHYFRYIGEVPWKAGECYKIRIDFNHMVVNNSNENRYHIIVHGQGGLDEKCF